MYLVLEREKDLGVVKLRILERGKLVAADATTWNVTDPKVYKKCMRMIKSGIAHSYVYGNVYGKGATYAMTMEESTSAIGSILGPDDMCQRRMSTELKAAIIIGILGAISGLVWVAFVSLIKFAAAMVIFPFALWLALRVFRRS